MQPIHEFIKILGIQKNFMLFVRKIPVRFGTLFTFGNNQVMVTVAHGFHIKKVGPFAGPHRFGVMVFVLVSLVHGVHL